MTALTADFEVRNTSRGSVLTLGDTGHVKSSKVHNMFYSGSSVSGLHTATVPLAITVSVVLVIDAIISITLVIIFLLSLFW